MCYLEKQLTKQKILDAFRLAFWEEQDRDCKVCTLKARLFEMEIGVFDVLKFTADTWWVEVGLEGRANRRMVEAMAAVRRWQQAKPWEEDPPPTQPQGGSASVTAAPIGKLQLQRATMPAVLCAHHGVPDPKHWKHEPLRLEEEADLWDAGKFTRVMHDIYVSTRTPGYHSHVWQLVRCPAVFSNFIWDGNPVSREASYMWTTGCWTGSQQARRVKLGCLRCGYRTPLLFLYRGSIKERPTIASVFVRLFEG